MAPKSIIWTNIFKCYRYFINNRCFELDFTISCYICNNCKTKIFFVDSEDENDEDDKIDDLLSSTEESSTDDDMDEKWKIKLFLIIFCLLNFIAIVIKINLYYYVKYITLLIHLLYNRSSGTFQCQGKHCHFIYNSLKNLNVVNVRFKM